MASNYDMSWEDVPTTSSNRINYLKVENGKIGARIRIVSKPAYIETHWASVEGKNRKVNCAGADCLLCKAGVKIQGRYNFYVLDKTVEEDVEVKVYEAPASVFNSIAAYAKDEDLGNPTQYDIKIKKEGQGKDTRYSVMPLAKSPITDAEKALCQSMQPLKEILKPASNEYISSVGFDVLVNSMSAPSSSAPSSSENTEALAEAVKEKKSDWDDFM